jgi:hypothetical protein
MAFMTDLNWWSNIVAASFVGLVLTALLRGGWLWLRDFNDKKAVKINGIWYTYNMTNKDDTVSLAKYKWKFKRNFLTGRICASISSELDDTIKYEAELEIKEKHIYIYGRGKGHGENVSWIFKRKYPHTTQTSFSGACLGLDYNENLFCGISLLAKDKLPAEFVQKILEERYENCKSSNSSNINLLEGAGEFPPIRC